MHSHGRLLVNDVVLNEGLCLFIRRISPDFAMGAGLKFHSTSLPEYGQSTVAKGILG